MGLLTWEFAVFVAAALLLYYVLPRKVQWIVLLAANLAFYAFGGPQTLLYLGFTTLTTWLAGLILGRMNADRKTGKGRKRLVTAAVLILNFGLLFAVKYWNTLAAELSRPGRGLPQLHLLMPLGLSFYIFQSAGYVIDCYRGKQPPEKNPAKYALFVSFFPQLIQGPISRFRELGAQLTAPHAPSADAFKYGLQRILWGLLKKLVIADRAAIVANAVFGSHTSYGGLITALGVLFYCIQLYCDFSGGIDIALGVAEMFGIALPENFRRPILATSLPDFWRRWHITLGAWMRDYVFYPLALSRAAGKLGRFARKHIGNRAGKILPTALATFPVYFLIGVWHGGQFKYLVFGLYQSVLITGAQLLTGVFHSVRQKLRLSDRQPLYRAFQMLRTMLLIFIGRYLTRAADLGQAWDMLRRTFTMPCKYQLRDGTLLRLGGMRVADYLIVAAGMAVLLFVEWQQERGVRIRKSLEQKNAFVQWLCVFLPLLILLLTLVFRGEAIDATMIYQQV